MVPKEVHVLDAEDVWEYKNMQAPARKCRNIQIPMSSQPTPPSANKRGIKHAKIPEGQVASGTLANDPNSARILSRAGECSPACRIPKLSSKSSRPAFRVGLGEAFLCAMEDYALGSTEDIRYIYNNVRLRFLSLTIDSSWLNRPLRQQFQADSSAREEVPV